jgi:hypothetical protein
LSKPSWPSFKQLALNPGRQIPDIPLDDLATAGILLVMQGAWYRQLCIPIPFHGPKIISHHVLLCLARLSFIFGAAVFSVVFFRQLPGLGLDADIILLARSGLLLIVSLFALFCFTFELERVANAFGNNRQA